MMTLEQTYRRSRILAVLAGAMDFGTGLGMVFLPALTLRLMLVPVPGEEAMIYARFVGVFVGGIGFSYLWALVASGNGGLRAVLRFTIPFRAAAGFFCLIAVFRGELAPMWLSVTLADWGLVGLQVWLLRGDWEEPS